MTDQPEDYADRLDLLREARFRALGTRSPRCSVVGCKETDPCALTGTGPEIVCLEHRADEQGRSWIEDHHPAGQRNDAFTVPLPANDHGAISAWQSLWDRETLRNPDGSPLLRAAVWVRGWVEVMRAVIERGLDRIPGALERLDALLVEKLGARWWEALGWDW